MSRWWPSVDHTNGSTTVLDLVSRWPSIDHTNGSTTVLDLVSRWPSIDHTNGSTTVLHLVSWWPSVDHTNTTLLFEQTFLGFCPHRSMNPTSGYRLMISSLLRFYNINYLFRSNFIIISIIKCQAYSNLKKINVVEL